MELPLFLRGLAIGFALAAPVGPVGVLCIRRALADGRPAAFVAGMGAAFADTFYGAVAAFGLSAISSFLADHQMSIRLVGGSFLLILGVRGVRAAQKVEPALTRGPGLLKDFISTFLITLTNPGTILASMGVFAALGSLGCKDGVTSGELIGGVFAGSTLWWLVLSAAAGAVRSRCSARSLERLNHGSGLMLLLFGLVIMGSVATKLIF